MPLPASLLPWVVLHAATLSPLSVPARGDQDATLTLETPGYVRLRATSASGTACEVVDQFRGPFAQSGRRGKQSCDLSALLGAGTYRVRLHSLPKGKGVATLSATAFREQNVEPIALPFGQAIAATLGELEQASYAFRILQAGPVLLRVTGRTAGVVVLWRGGEFVEAAPWTHRELIPRPGQPVHEWWLSARLEAGDYRLTAYGTEAQTWTEGVPGNVLSVQWGSPTGGHPGSETGTLSESGLWMVQIPAGPAAAVITVLSAPESRVELGTFSSSPEGIVALSNPEAHCEIARKAAWRDCAVLASSDEAHLLWVRGPPGASFAASWAPMARSDGFVDGAYGTPSSSVAFEAPSEGSFLLATHDVPADSDSAPLSCSVVEEVGEEQHLIARDALSLAVGATYERAFNYDGGHEVLEFQLPTPGHYRITTTGNRKSRCELYALEGLESHRLTQSGAAGKCDFTVDLRPGFHQLTLNGGTAGIETVRVAPVGTSGAPVSFSKSACLFPKLQLHAGARYTLQTSRAGDIAARGIHLRPHPFALAAPLPLLLPTSTPIAVPLAANLSFLLRGPRDAAFRCGWDGGALSDAVDGVCSLPPLPRASTLRLESRSREGIPLILARPTPARPAPKIAHLVPRPFALPPLDATAPAHFSLERGGSHSRGFEVKEPGLYDVTTEGLLATRCELRTPVIPLLAEDTGSGRGRNCLVAAYLRPGRYAVTVRAQGQSKGRASLRLAQRPLRTGDAVSSGGESFFRSGATELVQQRLHVETAGNYRISTVSTSAASLACRLEDSRGWPVLPVPSSCTIETRLAAGEYRWTQLPVTVDTQRRTQLEKIARPTVLHGNQVHAVEMNTVYPAVLGKDGSDDFTFALSVDAPVRVRLTNGVQGRLYAAADSARQAPVETIPPDTTATEAPSAEDARAAVSEESMEGEGGDEMEDGEGSPPPETPEPPALSDAPEPPGHLVTLKAGSYRLVTQHSRGDVAIRYSLAIGSGILLPGQSRELSVPTRVPVRVGVGADILRLTTRGSADVRCRLLDKSGKLLAESSEQGSNWNCALAEPLPEGDHVLVLESENGLPGTTRVQLEVPPVTLLPEIPASGEWKVAGEVLRAPLPAAPSSVLQSVELSSSSNFSCALEDATGHVLERMLAGPRCDFHLRSAGLAHRIRVWSAGAPATIAVHFRARNIEAGSAGTLPAGAVRRIPIARASRYRTSETVRCGSAQGEGLLQPCGPEVSLEKGEVVFVSTGAQAAPLPLSEALASLDRSTPERIRLGPNPFIQRESAGRPAVHLLSVIAPPGARSGPACRLIGGAFTRTERGCFAAATGKEAEARIWSAENEPLEMELDRHAVELPSTAATLNPGTQTLTWKGIAQRVRLPAGPHRVEWTLPPEAWAVRLDTGGGAQDLCAPQATLQRCRFVAAGGEAVIVSAKDPRAEAEVQLLEALPPPRVLAGLHEEVPASSGVMRFSLPAEPRVRQLQVEGAVACVLDRDDGRREGSCALTLPAGIAGRLEIEHRASPLRVLLGPTAERAARLAFGDAPPPSLKAEAPAWTPGQRLPLTGSVQLRSIVVASEGAFSLESEAGVCALTSEAGTTATGPLQVEGAGNGCHLARVLGPGRYQVRIRAFGDSPLRGGARWSIRPVEALREGVANELWVGPGEVRYFRFSTASAGKIGLGLQAPSDSLDCTVLDTAQRELGEGCQQLLVLPEGSFFLAVRGPPEGAPQRFRPVLVGLAGAKTVVPREYLESFFQRIGETP